MKKQPIVTLVAGLGVLALTGTTYAATYNTSLTGGYTAAQLVDKIVPVGGPVVVTAGSQLFNGSGAANTGFNTSSVVTGTGGTVVGTFDGGDAGLAAPNTGALGIPFQKGIVMATGYLATSATPNNSDLKSDLLGSAGSPILEAGSGVLHGPNVPVGSSHDAATLQFKFKVAAGHAGFLTFQYAFASDEYSEFVPTTPTTTVDDAFAFVLIDGSGNKVNLATVGPLFDPISVKTVNDGYIDPDTGTPTPPSNPAYFTDNTFDGSTSSNPLLHTGDPYQLEYDGIAGGSDSLPLFAQYFVTPGQEYTLILSIADVPDNRGDSAVYIKENSIEIRPPTVPEPSTYVGALALAGLVARRLRRKA